ncbi:hypothetical protein BLOT_014939 [Blomia tropicalis]|nr:hypothetical protein BLOT_014939 [Blomia tropicalis]
MVDCQMLSLSTGCDENDSENENGATTTTTTTWDGWKKVDKTRMRTRVVANHQNGDVDFNSARCNGWMVGCEQTQLLHSE